MLTRHEARAKGSSACRSPRVSKPRATAGLGGEAHGPPATPPLFFPEGSRRRERWTPQQPSADGEHRAKTGSVLAHVLRQRGGSLSHGGRELSALRREVSRGPLGSMKVRWERDSGHGAQTSHWQRHLRSTRVVPDALTWSWSERGAGTAPVFRATLRGTGRGQRATGCRRRGAPMRAPRPGFACRRSPLPRGVHERGEA